MTTAIMLTGTGRTRAMLQRAAKLSPGEHRLLLLLAERGDCRAALQAKDLMPHHATVKRMADGIAGSGYPTPSPSLRIRSIPSANVSISSSVV